jgi:hypothetical protein
MKIEDCKQKVCQFDSPSPFNACRKAGTRQKAINRSDSEGVKKCILTEGERGYWKSFTAALFMGNYRQ